MQEIYLDELRTPEERFEEARQARDDMKERINAGIDIARFFKKARHGGHICPACGSGSGAGGTGAIKIYKDTNTAYCHKCGARFDVLAAIMQAESCDYNAALAKGAEMLGAFFSTGGNAPAREYARPGTPQDAPAAPQSDETAKADKIPAESTKGPGRGADGPTADYSAYYDQCAARLKDPAALAYLAGRGIDPAIAERVGAGFDPAADPANVPGAMGDEHKPHPAPRIIFPCTSSYYVARSIDTETPAAFKAPNPKGSTPALWNAGALQAGRGEAVFIVEGIFDALSFLQAGGAALALNSASNAKILAARLQEIRPECTLVIATDNDDPGRKAAEEIRRACMALGIKYKVMRSEYHDANDELQADPGVFAERIRKAKEIIKQTADERPRDELDEFFDKIQTEAYKPQETGLRFFDRLLSGGVVAQSVFLLLAAPGTGKTTLCQQLAEEMARHGKHVLYLNFEMSKEQMLAKALSYHRARKNAGGKKSMKDVLQGYSWSERDRQTMRAELEEYRVKSYPFIRYKGAEDITPTIDNILDYLEKAGQEAERTGTDAPAVIVDYLHLIIPGKEKLEAADLIKKILVGLKQYAIKYNTFVICITATNRQSNESGRLTMSSGRDSSNIEYTADYQLSLNYWDIDQGIVKNDPDEKGEIEAEEYRRMIIRVLKDRQTGRTGHSMKLYYNAANNIFYDEHGTPEGANLKPFKKAQSKKAKKEAEVLADELTEAGFIGVPEKALEKARRQASKKKPI